MQSVTQKLQTPNPRATNTPSKNSSDSKGPLNWREDSCDRESGLEDIQKFIDRRNGPFQSNFSFQLTRTEDPGKSDLLRKMMNEQLGESQQSESESAHSLKQNLANVFQEVVGNTLLKEEDKSFTDSFLKTEDYQLSLTRCAPKSDS